MLNVKVSHHEWSLGLNVHYLNVEKANTDFIRLGHLGTDKG